MSRPAGKRPADEKDNADAPRPAKKVKSKSASSAETIQLPDGKRYTGQINESREPHGGGTKFRADGGEEASGQWRNGKLHGRGKRSYQSGDHYKGNFVNGEMSGLGKYTWAADEVYEGEFRSDLSHGFGIYWTAEGEVAKCGRWADDELVESCPVPLSKIPIGLRLSAAARAADPSRTLLLPNGGHYVGAFNTDFRQHGQGVEFRADGSEVASGQWRNGGMHGCGKVIYDGGDRYKGGFVDGQRSGVGTFTWADGRVYEGEWSADEATEDRARTLLLPGGGHYVGDFNEDFRQHGEGTWFRVDGAATANGTWRNGKLHGRGKMTHANGNCYEGDFVDGKKSGLGTYTWADGSVYEGELDGSCSGLGVYWDKKGKLDACGRWKENGLIKSCPVPRSKIPIGTRLSEAARAADPSRTLLLPNGGHYVGAFNTDFRQHGQGVEFRADGSEVASGQWRGGKPLGRGKMILFNGECYEGDWLDGQFSGLGTYTWPDGSVYEGEFSKGNFNGFGVQWAAEDKVAKCGRWVDDELAKSCPVPLNKIPTGVRLSAAVRAADLDSVLLLPNGGHFEGEFNADFQPHGEGAEYDADGSKFASGQWRDGKMHGRGKMNLPQGSRYEGDFVDEEFCGLGTFTWAAGSAYEGEWAADRRSGLGVQWDGGEVMRCGRWADKELVESCVVPRNKLPTGLNLSAAAKLADLICPGGGHYCGALNAKNEPHGAGSLHRADGSEATRGDWTSGRLLVSGSVDAQGRLQGVGSQWTAIGFDEGNFVDGQLNGLGALTSFDGVRLEGEWVGNKRNGLGVEWNKDGKVLQCGRWANDKLVESCAVPLSKIPIGAHLSAAAQRAALICPGGGHYCGSLNGDNEPHGPGSLHRADGGEAVRGDWAGGRLWVSGACDAQSRLQGAASEWSVFGFYEGNFIDGQRSGMGKLTSLDDSRFEGEWADGKRNGLGIQWDKDRTVIGCGRWAHDKLEEEQPVPRSKIPVGEFLSEPAKAATPELTLLLSSGGHYVGEFNENFKQHGQGVEYRADGSETTSGQWRDGHLNGRGKLFFPDGHRYEGDFIDNRMNGLGALTWANDEVYEGEFVDGQRSGLGVQWDEDAKVLMCGRWAKDKLMETRSVPRSKLPAGTIRNAAANDAALLFPDGGFYRGEINARFLRHGKGSMHSADGAVRACDSWQEDQLADLGVGDAAVAGGGHSTGAVGSGCVVCQSAPRDCLIDCPHFCLCIDCAAKVDRCPLCRMPITHREEKRVVPLALIPPRAGEAAGPQAAVATAAAASTVSASAAVSGAHGPDPAAAAVGSGLAKSAAVPAASLSSAVAAATSAMAVDGGHAAADSAAPPAASPRASNGDVAACAVCRSAPPDSIIDCPHFCLCMECATVTDRCPVCTVIITRRDQRRIIFS